MIVVEWMPLEPIAMTFDTYGHLMPGGFDEAAAATNAYLARLTGERPALTVVG
jgi:hypothetical protein